MFILLTVYLLLVGFALGSFTLLLVDRMHAKKNWVSGRSECVKCKKKLEVRDLIPVLSWVYNRGQCRHCKVKLSKSYPISELALGAGLALSFVFWPVELNSAIAIAMFVVWIFALILLSALFIYDMRWFLLPNKLVFPLIYTSVVWMILDVVDKGFTAGLVWEYLLSICVSSGLFLVLFVISQGKWIGDGDIRLGLAIGLFTGSWAESWLVIFVASVIGLVFAAPQLLKKSKKDKLKMKLPFGPALILALYIVMLVGAQIIEWYKTDILLL